MQKPCFFPTPIAAHNVGLSQRNAITTIKRLHELEKIFGIFAKNCVFATPLAAHNVGLSQRYAIIIKSLNELDNMQRVDVTRRAERKCNATRA